MVHGELDHHLRAADRARAERRASRIQRLEGDLEAVTLLADEVRGGDAAVLEDDLAGRGRAEAELLLLGPAREAGQRAVLLRDDREAGDFLVAVLLGGVPGDPGEHREEPGEGAIRDPLFRAVQNVLVRRGVVDGGRLQGACVRAGFRFGEAERRYQLSAREVGQPFLLLFVVSEQEERLEADRLVGPDDEPLRPYSSGIVIPITPNSPIALTASRGKKCSLSILSESRCAASNSV